MSAAVEVEEFEVVVVGGGPGGLASAVTLASAGIRTLVVERRAAASTLPRATLATTSTMELLRRWGLEQEAWERAIDVEWQAWATPTLADADRAQASLFSPTGPALIAQDEVEPLLERRLATLSSARLERGVEMTALRTAEDGHALTLADADRRRRRVRARYVIGADGPRSAVRNQLGISTVGSERIEERLAVLFRAPLWELAGPHRYGIYFITGEPANRSLIPAGKPDRWLLGMPWDSSVDDLSGLTDERMKLWIREAAGDHDLPIELERAMAFDFGIALADRFRAGDAFLIGDAAHRVTPRGGTGLNTAVRDGFDLGWKLAWVLRGWAGDCLLDSYERERRPVAEFNLERSTRADGSILANSVGIAADIGGRIAHAWVERDGGLVSTLDLLGDGLTLFAGPDYAGAAPEADPGAAPVAVERLDAIAARALGLTPAGSLLARPDGYPVALWNDECPDGARLARAIAAASGAAQLGPRPGVAIPDS